MQISTRLQSMVGRTASVISHFYSLLPEGRSHEITLSGPFILVEIYLSLELTLFVALRHRFKWSFNFESI